MILVDSSVWIDYFRGVANPQTDRLDGLLGTELLLVGDIIIAEVLQGFDSDGDFQQALRVMQSFMTIDIGGHDIAVQAARNYRDLRLRGITVRKTIDTLIAARCIQDNVPLLFSDRDFEPFVAHLGLKSALSVV